MKTTTMADHVSSPSSSTPTIPTNTIQSEPSIDNPSQPPSVGFSSSEMQRLHAPHNRSLFVKVLGRRLRYDHFSSSIRRLLQRLGNLDVIPLMNGFFLVKFSDETDYQNALQNGPWTINYHSIVLLTWVPNINPSEIRINKVKVWIRLYGLPVEYYDREALSRIAQAIGPLVKIDPVTENMEKGVFARFCVEVDFNNTLPDSVELPNGLVQQVRYEGLRNFKCYGCNRLGHVQNDCPDSTSVVPGQVGPVVVPSEASGSHLPGHPSAAAGLGFEGFSDDEPDISGLNLTDQGYAVDAPEQVEPLVVVPNEVAAVATGLGFEVLNDDDLDIVNVPDEGYPLNAPGDSEPAQLQMTEKVTPLQDTSRGSPAPDLPILQIPEQVATLINTGTPSVNNYYFPVPGSSYNPVPETHPEAMTPGSRMKHQAILRGVEERVVSRVPVEMQETSNVGLPKVFAINPEVRTFSINVMIYSSGNGNLYRNILNPLEIDHTQFPGNPSPAKHWVLFFNCRGARDTAVRQALKDLVEKYEFSVVVLTETKTSGVEAEEVIGELGFSGSFIIEPAENSGGVWLLWDKTRINVEVQAHDQYYLWALAQAPIPAANLEQSWQYVFGVDD